MHFPDPTAQTKTVPASRIAKAYESARAMLKRKTATVINLEAAMGIPLLKKLTALSATSDGSQYRPKMTESPTRLAILKEIQNEEAAQSKEEYRSAHAARSAKLSRSVGINIGLDVEMRQ
jgi:hypothetical protein